MLRLNIGCGGTKKEGFIGIDIKPGPNAQITTPAHDLPYGDNTVDEIYTSHMIEHVEDVERTLKEFARVLKPNAKLTIRCPNFELYVREWLNGSSDYRWGWGIINLYGWTDRGINMFTRTGFTCERFRRVLPRCGFRNVDCQTVRTRTSSGPEYRKNGDLLCRCKKV